VFGMEYRFPIVGRFLTAIEVVADETDFFSLQAREIWVPARVFDPVGEVTPGD